MPEVRQSPVVSAGPQDFIHAIYAVLEVKGADAEWAMERRMKDLTLAELQSVAQAVALTPFGSSPGLSFERAMAEIADAKADVTPPAAA